MARLTPDEQANVDADLTTDGRPIEPCPHQPFDWFAEMSAEAWAAYEEAERKGW